jgi:hypothetical protein
LRTHRDKSRDAESLHNRPFAAFAVRNPLPGTAVMAVAKAYVDDSGNADDPQHSACSIAGFVGTADQWTEFERRWSILLDGFGLPYLHMREFAHHLPPFARLTCDERKDVLHSLIQTIKDCELSGYGAVIRLPDLNRFNRERSRNLEALPLALYACMNDIYVADPWREVDMALDRFDKPDSVIAKARRSDFWRRNGREPRLSSAAFVLSLTISGIRHIGGANLNRALVRNVRTSLSPDREPRRRRHRNTKSTRSRTTGSLR